MLDVKVFLLQGGDRSEQSNLTPETGVFFLTPGTGADFLTLGTGADFLTPGTGAYF